MNTPIDPRALAHRLTTVGHALHHRLFAHLHDSGIHPKTLLLLDIVDGRIDAPGVADRLARSGKRTTALADRGWIAREGDGWSITDDGRALLDRVDAERSALLADVAPEQLENLNAALDALATTLGVGEEAATPPPRGFRVELGAGPRAFGPGSRRAFGPNEHRGFRTGERPGPRPPVDAPASPDAHGDHPGRGRGDHRPGTLDPDRGAHECRGGSRHHRRRGEERAFERGFDAGFRRGREAGAPPAAQS